MNLIERHYEQLGTNFRAVWDFYMKYHIAFLLLNLTSLALVVELVQVGHRKLIVSAFVFQNLISAMTAVGIALYSAHCSKHQDAMVKLLGSKEGYTEELKSFALSSVIPEKLASWAGYANAAAHLVFIACWIAAATLQGPRF